MKLTAKQIGEQVKAARKNLGVTQKDLAMTSGTGLRFIIELEKGKPTCQLGKDSSEHVGDRAQDNPAGSAVGERTPGEYVSDKVGPANFEQLAEEAGLAKPITKRRVGDLAEAIVAKLPGVTNDHPVTVGVAKSIQHRCELSLKRFGR